MPRSGDGASDNVIDPSEGNIVHGVGNENSSEVDRSNKAVPPPSEETGAAIPGMNASGGGSQGAYKNEVEEEGHGAGDAAEKK